MVDTENKDNYRTVVTGVFCKHQVTTDIADRVQEDSVTIIHDVAKTGSKAP